MKTYVHLSAWSVVEGGCALCEERPKVEGVVDVLKVTMHTDCSLGGYRRGRRSS